MCTVAYLPLCLPFVIDSFLRDADGLICQTYHMIFWERHLEDEIIVILL